MRCAKPLKEDICYECEEFIPRVDALEECCADVQNSLDALQLKLDGLFEKLLNQIDIKEIEGLILEDGTLSLEDNPWSRESILDALGYSMRGVTIVTHDCDGTVTEDEKVAIVRNWNYPIIDAPDYVRVESLDGIEPLEYVESYDAFGEVLTNSTTYEITEQTDTHIDITYQVQDQYGFCSTRTVRFTTEQPESEELRLAWALSQTLDGSRIKE